MIRRILDFFEPVKLQANKALVLEKYEKPFFKDKSIQQEIKKKGYAIRNLIDLDAVNNLKSSFDQILQHKCFEMTGLFWSSGRSSSTEIRNLAKNAIDEHIKSALMNVVMDEYVELIGGVFVVKPPSKESSLSPHQDSSHINEDTDMSIYAWCALTDTHIKNGAVYVLPGSHLFGNIHRSLNIPWQFEPYKELMWEYCIPLPMKAGEVLFFDSALIHCSPPNLTDELRLGANFFIQPKGVPFTHYYRDETTPNGFVEKFHVSIDFYYNEDFEKRPSDKYPFLGMETYRDLKLSTKRLKKLCELALEYANNNI